MSMVRSRLVLTNVEKRLGDLEQSILIKIPSFELREGEIVAIVGSNGCGKSTMLDMIAMLLKPDKVGQFHFYSDNRQQTEIPSLSEAQINLLRRNNIAYILQSGGLLNFLTLKQNILLVTRLKKGKQADFARTVTSLGLDKLLNKKPMQLSGGQRQKGAIARALIQQPDIILADEPTSAMDSISAVKLMEVLTERVRNSGTSLILVSHDATLVKNVANRVYRFSVEQLGEQTVSTLHEEYILGE
ncbi:ABC transporter ATP-binding protein [Vibrio sp. WXL103]|uniref:ABC transporter ATP-binding protein n=1 Tax=Vibrio sp. WXL103 TaxID=3450710 RepID=UPI003EC8D9F0